MYSFVLLSLFAKASVVGGIVPIHLNQQIKLSQEHLIVPKMSWTALASSGSTFKRSLVKDQEGWLMLPEMGFLNLAWWSPQFALRAEPHIPQRMWYVEGDTSISQAEPTVTVQETLGNTNYLNLMLSHSLPLEPQIKSSLSSPGNTS